MSSVYQKGGDDENADHCDRGARGTDIPSRSANAQAVGRERIITFTVDEMDKFKPLVKKLVAETEKEPGAMQYEYTVGPDQKTVDIYER